MSYTEHADALFDTGAPVLGPTHLEARDNLIASMNGDRSGDAIPELYPRAIEQVAAGTSTRMLDGNTYSTTSSTVTAVRTYLFMQAGVIRLSAEARNTVGTLTVQYRVVSAGSNTDYTQVTAASVGSFTAYEDDLTVAVGDRIEVRIAAASGGGTAEARNITFKTNGEDLWPTENMAGYITGNRS